jgi:protease-4
MAKVQEVRDAILEFGEKNKITIAFSGNFKPLCSCKSNNCMNFYFTDNYTQENYYLSTAFQVSLVQPTGGVELVGFNSINPFFRGLFDKLEITPKFSGRNEYKTAMNIFTHRSFTEAHKEAAFSTLDSHFQQLLSGISYARRLSLSQVKKTIDSGPYLANDAMKLNLVDGLCYKDEVLNIALQLYNKVYTTISLRDKIPFIPLETINVVPLRKYYLATKKKVNSDNKIAIIYAEGDITNVFDDEFSPDKISTLFKMAMNDPNIKSIVLRINSPGGDALASDTIWRNIINTQNSGKKVIASIGDYAASGGYYIASPCHKIIAEPSSITGSIGVFGGILFFFKFFL